MNKKTLFLSAFIFLCIQVSYGQDIDFSKVDKHARETPEPKASSIQKLADHLTREYKTETEKVRAIYVWLTDNIKYNHRVIDNENISIEQKLKKENAERVLKARWAVCEGYSNLFQALCEASGIASEVATGQVKDNNGKIAPIGHAWNIVRADGKWQPVDVTWGAGGLSNESNKFVKAFNDQFFLCSPKEFIQQHFPKDPLFQLLENPVSFEDFIKGKLVPNAPGQSLAFPNITDTLNQFTSLDDESKTINSCRRILKFDPKNGFANNNTAKYHYDKAKAVWQLYQNESKDVFDKKKPLTWELVEKWEGQIAEFRGELEMTEKYLNNIQPGDQYADNKKSILSSIAENKKMDAKIDKQFSEYKKYLSASGVSKN